MSGCCLTSMSPLNRRLNILNHELILASLSGAQLLIDTDRRHHVKV